MSYIDAGYAIALGTLFVYAALLWLRHWRLERLASALYGTQDDVPRRTGPTGPTCSDDPPPPAGQRAVSVARRPAPALCDEWSRER
ncbi:MAG: hypothetical protein ABSC00_08630 [Acidimicrobiales bacterium]|jgi:hypothetical protein